MSDNFVQYYMGTNSLNMGYGDVKSFVKTAKEKGLSSLVLADVGTTAAYVKFYNECQKNNIKPVLGLTAPIKNELIDALNYVDKNEDIIRDLLHILPTQLNYEQIKNFNDLKIVDFYNSLLDLRIFEPQKGKRKEVEYRDSLISVVKSLGLEEEILEDKEISKSLISWITHLKSKKLPHQGYLKLASKNDKGVIEINELLTHAFKEGQSPREIEIEKSGDKIKRADGYYPLVSLELLSEKENIFSSLLTDFDDYIMRINSSSLRHRALKEIQNLIPDIGLGLDYQKYKPEELDKQIEHNEIMNFALNNAHEIKTYITHNARFMKEEEYDIYDIKSAALTDQWAYSPIRPKTGTYSQYIFSKEDFENTYREYPKEFKEESLLIESTLESKMSIGNNYLPASPIPEDYAMAVLREYFKENNLSFEENDSYEDLKHKYKENRLKKEDFSELSDLERELEIEKGFSNIISKPYLAEVAWSGIEKLLKKTKPDTWESLIDQYKERFEMELNIICNMGFAGYFLIVHDFIAEAKKRGIPVGPGRGSGAGSIIAYGLDITIPDPIEFDLVFERFLNPERVSMPDFDIDFCTDRRGEIIDYVMERYGRDAVSYIATEGKFKPKSAFKSLLRTMGYTVKQGDSISGVISDDPFLKIKDLEEDIEFQAYLEDKPAMKSIYKNVEKLATETSHMGVHAGGVVISPTKLSDFSAVNMNPDGTAVSTVFDKDDIETAGLVKFDFLGLSTLTVINNAVQEIKKNYGVDIDIDRIHLDDKKAFDLLKSALTQDVFQLSSSGMKDLVKRLQVEDLEDISALVALYRPGPMQSGMLESYVNRKNGVEEIKYLHPKAKSITENTYGTVIYQEQVMKIAQEVAGYTLGGADLLRRAMGKKKIEEMQKQNNIFLEGALKENQKERELELKESTSVNIELDLSGFHFLEEYIDENGHISNTENFKKFLTDFVGLDKQDLDYLDYETNSDHLDLEGLIEKYKSIMYPKIKNKVSHYMNEGDSPSVKELSTSIYFSIFENIRYQNIFNVIEKFAGYGFNKSHSLAYAFVSYQTAYLKANYPKEFFAAVLTGQDKLEKISPIVYDMENNMGIKLNTPSVNTSNYKYSSGEGNTVNFGLVNIKSLGRYGKLIEREREVNGAFQDIQDLMYRVHYRNLKEPEMSNSKLSSGAFKGLLYSGALDEFIVDRKSDPVELMAQRELLLKEHDIIVSNYPKNIEEVVEDRLEKGFYSKSSIHYLDNYTQQQNLLIKKVAYAKKFEDLIEEGFNIKELYKSYIEQPSELLNNFSIVIKNLEKNNEFNKDYFKLIKKGKSKLSEKDFNKLISLEKEFIEKINNNPDLKNNFMEVGKKVFGQGFVEQGFGKLVEAIYYYDKEINSKRKNKSDMLPLRLYELKELFDSGTEDYFNKAKSTIQILKKRAPELIVGVSNKLKEGLDYSASEWLGLEKDYTGLFLTMHPVNLNSSIKRTQNEFNPVIKMEDLQNIIEDENLFEERKGGVYYIASSITDLKIMNTKSGGQMAIVNLSDETGDQEVVLFDPLMSELESHLKEGIVGAFGIEISEYNDKVSLRIKEVKLHSPDINFIFGKENVRSYKNDQLKSVI